MGRRAESGGQPGRHTVTLATAGTLTRAPLATTIDHSRPLVVAGLVRRAATVIGDLLGLAAILLCIPFVILAIGTPLALSVRFVLWIVGML